MQLNHLVELVSRVRETRKKSEKTALLAEFLGRTRGRETELAAAYLAGTLPQGRIGIGWRSIQRVLDDAPPAGEPLSLADIDRTFDAIAADQGTGSSERKLNELRRLMSRAGAEERRFLAELLLGELRQGALEGLLLDAVAKAAQLPAADVRRAMMFSGSIGEVARAALEDGAAGLVRFQPKLLTPIAPMLAATAEDVDEALSRLEEAAFEFKLDGARIQVHKAADEVRIFTRQLQDVTGRLPEIVEWVRELPLRELVLEGEAIALRPDGRPLPFQTTMRRFGRTKNVERLRRELPISYVFFDCLYREGEGSLISVPYRERFVLLGRTIPDSAIVPNLVTANREEAARFLERSLAAGHEGVMAKSLLAPYAAGQRGSQWLKLKPAPTLDLVVLAAEWGHGRRSGWLSNLHLGARDPASGQFIMLGKTFKGLTDELLAWQTEQLLARETGRDGITVHVRPELVVEIAYGGIQESPRYPAGLALRFARVKRYRPEKPAAEADTIQTVAEIFRKQHE